MRIESEAHQHIVPRIRHLTIAILADGEAVMLSTESLQARVCPCVALRVTVAYKRGTSSRETWRDYFRRRKT